MYKLEIHRHDPETRQWRECGRLPVGMYVPCCAVLPSGDLMVAGGVTGYTKAHSKRMWIGNKYKKSFHDRVMKRVSPLLNQQFVGQKRKLALLVSQKGKQWISAGPRLSGSGEDV